MRWTARVWIGLSIVLLACMPVPAAAQDAAAPEVRNPARPAEGSVTLRLRELWRVGADDEEQLLGVIGTVLADGQGNLYLLDTQLSQVLVYSPEGEYLRTLARPGQGPGEVERPGSMFFTPEGHVALVQTFPGRIVIVTRDNQPAGGFLVGGSDPSQGRFGVVVAGGSGGGQVYLAGMHMSLTPQGVSEQNYYFASCDLQGNMLHTFAGKTYTINYADFVFEEAGIDFVWSGRWAVDAGGRVFLAPDRDRYRIEVFAPDGRLERVISREYESWSRTPAERTVARQQLQAVAGNYQIPPRELITLDTEADITGLHCAQDGTLWVSTSRGDRERPAGAFSRVDVFDAGGRFVREVVLSGPGDPSRDALFLLGGDRAVVVTGALGAYQAMQGVTDETGASEAEPLQVICYALER